MLEATTNTSIQFFERNPSGRILGRFSNDLGIVDKILPDSLGELLEGTLYSLAQLLALVAINPFVLLQESF